MSKLTSIVLATLIASFAAGVASAETSGDQPITLSVLNTRRCNYDKQVMLPENLIGTYSSTTNVAGVSKMVIDAHGVVSVELNQVQEVYDRNFDGDHAGSSYYSPFFKDSSELKSDLAEYCTDQNPDRNSIGITWRRDGSASTKIQFKLRLDPKTGKYESRILQSKQSLVWILPADMGLSDPSAGKFDWQPMDKFE